MTLYSRLDRGSIVAASLLMKDAESRILVGLQLSAVLYFGPACQTSLRSAPPCSVPTPSPPRPRRDRITEGAKLLTPDLFTSLEIRLFYFSVRSPFKETPDRATIQFSSCRPFQQQLPAMVSTGSFALPRMQPRRRCRCGRYSVCS